MFALQNRNSIFQLFFVTVALSACTNVSSTEAAFKVVLGKIEPTVLSPGANFYNILTTNIVTMDLRERKIDLKTSAYTKDTQTSQITLSGTVSMSRDKAVEIYTTIGTTWEEKTVAPVLLGSLKTIIGQYVADEMVGKRSQIRENVSDMVNAVIESKGMKMTVLEISNIDFTEGYEKAVEAKATAYQNAQGAANRTVQIQEESKQKIISAEAEAKSMLIRSEALAKNKGLVEYEAVQKWDGKLPQYMLGGATPFINIGEPDRIAK